MAGVTNANARSTTIDAVMATTIDQFYKSGKMHDNIFKSNPTFAALRKGDRIKYGNGGYQINVGVMHGKNSTVGSYAGYEPGDVTAQDGMTQAIYKWAQYMVATSIDGMSEFQNGGMGNLVKLITEKTKQSMSSLSEDLNEDVWDVANLSGSTTGNSGKNIVSLPMICCVNDDDYPGGIDPSSYSWWDPQRTDGSAATWAAMLREFHTLYYNCTKGGGGSPDLLVSDLTTFKHYENAMEDKRMYIKAADGDATAGFEGIHYRSAKYFWDEHVPDMKTSVNWDSGSFAAGSCFFLNTKFLKLMLGTGKDFKPLGWRAPVNQDARTNLTIVYLQLITSNRRKQGVLHDISTSLAS